jgi:GNAT superfamily N-acetyltransferase
MAERDELFWAKFLGIEAADWQVPGVCVRPHAGLGDYQGLWSFRHAERVVVSAPPSWVERLGTLIRGVAPEQLLEAATWQRLLADACLRTVGPAYQGCLAPERFVAAPDADVERIAGDPSATFVEFRDAVGAEAWDEDGIDDARLFVAVRREGSHPVALCGYRSWAEDAGDPCVVVHPSCRGRGYGTAVVSAVVESALEAGKTLLYQTLESNHAATAIAAKLGYEQFAQHLAVRLKSAEPS